MTDQDLRALIIAKLDEWAAADDPGEVYDATLRMYNALRAVVAGPDWGEANPSYLPQPWASETIAAELGIDVPEEAGHACSNCGGVNPSSCMFNATGTGRA